MRGWQQTYGGGGECRCLAQGREPGPATPDGSPQGDGQAAGMGQAPPMWMGCGKGQVKARQGDTCTQHSLVGNGEQQPVTVFSFLGACEWSGGVGGGGQMKAPVALR
jgi:hypothetical protein